MQKHNLVLGAGPRQLRINQGLANVSFDTCEADGPNLEINKGNHLGNIMVVEATTPTTKQDTMLVSVAHNQLAKTIQGLAQSPLEPCCGANVDTIIEMVITTCTFMLMVVVLMLVVMALMMPQCDDCGVVGESVVLHTIC